LNYYLINTGGIGEGERYREIRLEFTMTILDSLLRGSLEDWVESPTGFRVPGSITYVDDIYLHPEKLYTMTEFEEGQGRLNQIRCESVEELGNSLHPDIRELFSKPNTA
jgi:ATP-dependent phosphoenolpyruvate carboxykinase